MTTRSFEEALKKLENIVHRIEEGQMSLDETLKAFEEGVKLARFCQSKLDEAQKKVEILMKDEKGNLRSRPFQEE
jgi:exodeoxyribonuclease VII small subunit